MKKFRLICLISIITLSTSFYAKSQSEPEDLLDTFFEIFDVNVDEAIDFLFSSNPLIDPSQQGIKAIKERLDISRRLLGEYYGHEKVREYEAGYSYRKYIYALKYERQPLKIEIILYKPGEIWKVQNVNFHDDVGVDFKIVE